MSDDPPAARPPHGGYPVGEGERQATFSDVFAVREYRAFYLAGTLSWVGDYLARAAITVLVYQQTNSALLSAASFAISYLPWILGGPVLAALVDRYPYRRVMILCDLTQMLLIAVLLIPGLPVATVLALLFLATLSNPPAQAAKSAMLPLILPHDRLVVGLSVNTSTNQAAQVVGYLAGTALAVAFGPRWAIAIDVATFAASAILITRGVRVRPAANGLGQRTHLLRETGEGFTTVFGNRVRRPIAVLAFSLMLFAIVPEGLAAAWAGEITADANSRGVAQAMIMAASPVGCILGGLLIGRLVSPARRRRLIRPLAVIAPLALAPAFTAPSAPVVASMALASSVAVAGLLPTLNGIFVLTLPHGFRARAFGVMQGGMQLVQGGAVMLTGLLAEQFSVPAVVGVWSGGGVVLMMIVVARWPNVDAFNATIAAASAVNAPATSPAPANAPATAAGSMER